jgi:hypothetical protein
MHRAVAAEAAILGTMHAASMRRRAVEALPRTAARERKVLA